MPTPLPRDEALRAARRRKGKIALLSLLAVVAIVFGVGWNPPTKTVHTFSTDSDYKASNDSGCTNSGPGCHGKETSYSNFNAYHPNAKCATCHDFTGVACIPCHAPNKNHECALCHDGSMKNAPDRVRISDPFPRGHYRETSHTVVAQDMSQPVTSEQGGSASATCSDCHSSDLKTAHTDVPIVAGSSYGESVGCGECHNDVRAYGLAEVLGKWKARDCKVCHRVGSSSPMHSATVAKSVPATGSPSCANTGSGCHDGDDLHAIHADAPKHCSGSAKKGEPGCHVLKLEAQVPTATTCGSTASSSCHRADGSGTYQHKNVSGAHAPTNQTAASNFSYFGVPCGGCHLMSSNGSSLIAEHSRATSARSGGAPDGCRNCHNNPASEKAVADKWLAADTSQACSTCHGRAGLAAAHVGTLTATHISASPGCASTGAGCHPSADLSQVGQPTTGANIHATCLRCHSARSNGYDPSKTTCGAGRDCHAQAGAYDPRTSVHNGTAGLCDGVESAHHAAGGAQSNAVWRDLVSGTSTRCDSCHSMVLGTEHARPNSSMASASNSCVTCHDESWSAATVKASWADKNSDRACTQCHSASGAPAVHARIDATHDGVELGVDGLAAPGSCVKSGCHSTSDLRRLHRKSGCAIAGCHSAVGDIDGRNLRTCGGSNSFSGCHAGYSAENHFVSHRADMAGKFEGVTYGAGANVGCFGCHAADLVTEHARELAAGAVQGGASSSCRICHADPDDPNAGRHAALPDVESAIAGHDARCISCHASGSSVASVNAVASPHKRITTAEPAPSGKVWSDPLTEWKAAFDSPTGGGHNALPFDLVGGQKNKLFPQTKFTIGGQSYTWVLPANSGSTEWLKASVIGGSSAESTEAIQHAKVSCADCHTMPEDMLGPHGSAVHIGIDPAYSQTQYADPTPNASQFSASGTNRVVCFKCHVVPGGAAVHGRHESHDDLPSSNAHHYGEKCVDCHVRIPHAWKRPRLLVRTVVTTDGIAPDTYPYVAENHDGLQGIVLRDFASPTDLRSRYCATGGCHPTHSAARHPLPSDIPTASYWP